MKKFFSPSFEMQRDSQWSHIAFAIVAILVALAMFVAASGAGSDAFPIEQPLPDWFNNGANVISIIWAILVLIPRTRVLGAILVVINMALSMYVNYVVGGVEFFVFTVAYNSMTIMLAALLVGHYSDDLPYLFKRTAKSSGSHIVGGAQ